jgi:hypothetical protein
LIERLDARSHLLRQQLAPRNLMSWSRGFDAPIALPEGRELHTLRDAGEYIISLPKAQPKHAPAPRKKAAKRYRIVR